MIVFSNVNKWYGPYHALADINAEVKKGEVVVVCGPSGSGKSTLIRTVNRLEDIKSGARNSADGYRAAGPSILAVRRAYEKELWDSGAVDLVKSTTVDADGRFVVADLPAGDWLLIATHSVKIDKHAAAGSAKQRGVYSPKTHLTGFQRVTVWLREVTVANGQSENLELTDRGAWFSGVVEERAPDAGR